MSPTAFPITTRRPFFARPAGSFPLRRAPLAAQILLIAIALLAGGCRKKTASVPTPPPPPAPPNFLAQADAAYTARNYSSATDAYQNFLKANPQAPESDRALFRMAMAYFVKDSPLYDAARALESLRQLTTTLPASPYATEANLYLTLHDEVAAQQQTLAERSRRVEDLMGELARLKLEDGKKAEELQKLKAEAARREERIRQATSELERLKAIDMRRLPAAPKR